MLVIPFSLTVSASSAEPIGFILEALQGIFYVNTLNESVRDMTPDEFYNFMVESDSFDANAWRALVANLSGPVCLTVCEELENMKSAKYNAVKVSEDQLQSIYDQATKIKTQNIRTFSFDDIGLTTATDFQSTLIYSGYNCIPCLGSSSTPFKTLSNNLDGKFTVGTGVSDTSVLYYNGSTMAFPVFYVSADALLFQNGVALPSSNWYVPIGSDKLIAIPASSFLQAYTTVGETETDLTFGFYITSRQESCPIYKNGEIVGYVNTDEYPGWEVADLLSKMVGYCFNPEPISIPTDIPYDDDGNVYVCIPEDKSDVVYLSPTTYNEYINNGTIIEGDYVSNVTDETVNNIYDDTNLLNKLEGWFDDLSDKLSDIKTKLNLILLSITFDNIIDTVGDFLGYDDFDKDKFDLEWKTLVQSKLPILYKIEDLLTELGKTSSPLVIEGENPMNWLLGSVPDEERQSNFVINVAWFTDLEYKDLPLRGYIRQGLSILVYIAFFASMVRSTDSIFRNL